jgi:diguanylate cyclase (GGDEF)-like protein
MRCPHLVGEGTSVCIPLIANGESIGTLALRDDQPPSPSEDPAALNKAVVRRRQLGITIARDVAIVISNLRLREALRLQAVRDPLTGLYNRRYMQEFLERELQRAVRRRRPVAVLMLDLDHFKRYNDTFGHSAGDKALAAVGETLLRAVREEDVACRYGGEEFTVIMAECTMQQATMRAEEIRRNVKECRIASGDERGAHLTASIGIAVFGETTDRMDLLLKFADDALYQAKRTGRDRVVVARPAATLGDALPDVPDSHGLASYEVSK